MNNGNSTPGNQVSGENNSQTGIPPSLASQLLTAVSQNLTAAPGQAPMNNSRASQLLAALSQSLGTAPGQALTNATLASHLMMGNSQSSGLNTQASQMLLNHLRLQAIQNQQQTQSQQRPRAPHQELARKVESIEDQKPDRKLPASIDLPKVGPMSAMTRPSEVDSGNSTGSESPKKRRDKSKQTSSIVPCRARAMPPDHNSSTAYFVIPKDVKHGENLLCSFPQCRNEGVKFCYCAICGIPVAKRNFRQRHEHANAVLKKKHVEVDRKRSNKRHATAVDASHVPKKRRSKQARKEEVTDQSQNNVPMKNLVFKRKVNGPFFQETSHQESSHSSDDQEMERKIRWVRLLRERPESTDGDEMSKWLMAVLDISKKSDSSSMSKPSKVARREQDANESSVSNDSTDSLSPRRSEESGESVKADWNSSSDVFSSVEAPETSETSSDEPNTASNNDNPVEMPDEPNIAQSSEQRSNMAVVSDFRNSTESSDSTDNCAGQSSCDAKSNPSSGMASSNTMERPKTTSHKEDTNVKSKEREHPVETEKRVSI